ncbi:VTT domain-containing protein [Curtobacterium flaccumfaciens pv. flaccumfaciens]|uniref:DedA family protein n=1 Tax=Curtobacterium flaccumfaciens TaxID=2035 RepID=UPI00217EC1E9|nr:VTT domain-containing protein [Curtobacterium flaccumfaciens]MCS6568756.1 VTT domain-containing protein [Curtobacterium flaccumfaciens pv. flaccumfaciens]MCS6584604.1 VTT domain-containing protein [Curtobacterium flaccumfaciens pv. flaccumfaciens]
MPSFLEGLPFRWLVLALFVIVFCRAQATYWVARLAVTGASRSRWGGWLRSPAVRRGSALLDRWGLPVVTVSFVVVGLQTVMNAAAGLARVAWWRYTIAMVPGCVAWAFLYATVGLAVFWAVVAALAGSPWGIAALVGLVVVAGVALTVLRRRRDRSGGPSRLP